MKRKNYLVFFSAAFLLVLLAVLATQTNAALTNNWGVEEGTTLTYKTESSFGDAEMSYEEEITIVKIADLDSPPDDLADLFYTYQLNMEGSEEISAGYDRISGDEIYTYNSILNPTSLDIPVLPIDNMGGVGLDWDAAKTSIEALLGYDEITVTVSDDDFEVVLEDSATTPPWGDWTETENIKWDKGEGILQSYSRVTEYNETGVTREYEITKGELSEGFVADNVGIIALGALGVAVLAILVVLIKR